MRLRLLLIVSGILLGGYGAWNLVDEDLADLLDTALWLGAGVVLHDFVLAPLVVLIGLGIHRWLPGHWRGPIMVVGIALGSVTLLAVPVLGRFGARPDNPSLLDRPYLAGWVGLVALGLLAVVGHVLAQRVRAAKTSRRGDGADPGR